MGEARRRKQYRQDFDHLPSGGQIVDGVCGALPLPPDVLAKWPVHSQTPFTISDDLWEPSNTHGESNLYDIALWCREHGIRAATHENYDRQFLPTGEQCRGHEVDGFVDFYFTSAAHRALFEEAWRGKMSSLRGHMM